MNAIYRVSGRDGSIQWQLGGESSSFNLAGFAFSRQHDARFLTGEHLSFKAEEGIEYVSFVNNVIDEDEYDEEAPVQSSVLVVGLYALRNEAKLIHRVTRPDGDTTIFGGNAHLLPNKNLFVSWADDGYVTEYGGTDLHLALEARFKSDRFTTYRAYKAYFEATPLDSPALKCFTISASATATVTVCYMSWNGATEVDQWRLSSPSRTSLPTTLAAVKKTGFETRMQLGGAMPSIYVEALDTDGKVIGTSEIVEPIGWDSRISVDSQLKL